MEILEKARKLFEELKDLTQELNDVEDNLKAQTKNTEEYIQLYEKEFLLAMRITGVYEDLDKALQELSQKQGMEFLATRMRRNAEEYMRTEIINVD